LHIPLFVIPLPVGKGDSVMAVKAMGQMSLAEALAPEGLGRNQALDHLNGVLRWYRFEKLLARLRDDGPGRPAYPPLMMFKALLLAQLYGLSDPELETHLGDRLSFRRFCGLSWEDTVPDFSTICRFRNLLIAEELHLRLFEEFDRQMERQGLVLKRGTMIDATLIEAATGRPSGDAPPLDADAAFAKRQGKPGGTTYGYKLHVGVDQGSGLIRTVITTPANVNETEVADDLICGDEAAVYADKAYDTHARRADLKARGVKDRIMHRANKHHPLPPRLKLRNRLIARRRGLVETTFAGLKQRMRTVRARYRGLVKTAAQMMMAMLAFNMRRAAVLLA
jgi:IS5 family transposase